MNRAVGYSSPSQNTSSELGISPSASDFGQSGPLRVTFGKYVSEAAHAWIPALKTLNLALNNHPLAGHNIGAGQHPASINPVNSTRSYSASAYLFPNSARSNLQVLWGALAEKIIWGPKVNGNVIATGVYFSSGGSTYTVTAKREVIVSGGTINTPQILELSGIGSAAVLAHAGVPQVVDLPAVGENLQDHT